MRGSGSNEENGRLMRSQSFEMIAQQNMGAIEDIIKKIQEALKLIPAPLDGKPMDILDRADLALMKLDRFEYEIQEMRREILGNLFPDGHPRYDGNEYSPDDGDDYLEDEGEYYDCEDDYPNDEGEEEEYDPEEVGYSGNFGNGGNYRGRY